MKPIIVWEDEDGSPNELQEVSLPWFMAMKLGNALMRWELTTDMGIWLWSKAYSKAVTIWEDD